MLKTTAVVSTLFLGNQLWGASAYTPGTVEDNGARFDTVLLGTQGDFTGATDPSASVKTLVISINTNGTAASNNAATTLTEFANTIKEIVFKGEARALGTIVSATAANALPKPPKGCILRFDLSESPASADFWFTAVPEEATIIIERGSADPKLPNSYYAAAKKLTLGRSIALAASPITFLGAVERHKNVSEKAAKDLARITIAAATTFSGEVKGISLSGSFAVVCNGKVEIVDVGTTPSGYTVGDGKLLTIIGAAAAPVFPASSAVTLGTGSKISVVDKH